LPFAHAQQPDQTRRFSVELSVATESLSKPQFRQNGRVVVHAKITNISSQDQTITVWWPGGGCWISDNPVISTEVNTLVTSEPIKKRLKPRESHAEDYEVFWYPRTQPTATFKLGFFPAAATRKSCERDTVSNDQIVWSNAIALAQ